MNISISGNYGSGKTTISRILARKLNMKHTYAGKITRELAKKRGMTLLEIQRAAKTDTTIDKYVDAKQKDIGESGDNYILEGHLAYFFAPKSIKIFLRVSEDVGAKRIFEDKSSIRSCEPYNKSFEETKQHMRERKEVTRTRWIKEYGTDFLDLNNYDLVIDSTDLTPEEVVDKIIMYLKEQGKI